MKFSDNKLVDWNIGDELIWFNVWDYNRRVFGIYKIKVSKKMSKSGRSEEGTHVFGNIVSVFYESPKMFRYEVGKPTPGCWSEEFSEDFNMLGRQRGHQVIEYLFS
jgi:hypothetical protein